MTISQQNTYLVIIACKPAEQTRFNIHLSTLRLWWWVPLPDREVCTGFRLGGRVMLPICWKGFSVWRSSKLQTRLHSGVLLCRWVLWRLQWDGHDVGTGQEWTHGSGLWGTTASPICTVCAHLAFGVFALSAWFRVYIEFNLCGHNLKHKTPTCH